MPSPHIFSVPGPAHRATESAVYVLPHHIRGRPLTDHRSTALYPIIQRHRAEIKYWIPDMEVEVVAYETEKRRSEVALRRWFHEFTAAYTHGDPEVPWKASGKGWRTLPRHPRRGWSDRMYAVALLHDRGSTGITQAELKAAMGSPSNGPTGALSVMHGADLIACLEETRLALP